MHRPYEMFRRSQSGQAIASVVLVLVPTESVPARFRATSIGLSTLAGEVMGATVAPILAGTLAQKHGLAVTMSLAAACYFWSHFFFEKPDPLHCWRSAQRLEQACRNSQTPEIRQRLYPASSPGTGSVPAVLRSSRNLNRCNLPVAVLGSTDKYSTHCGFL